MLPVAVRCVDPITRFCALAAFPGPNHNSLWRLPGNVPAKCHISKWQGKIKIAHRSTVHMLVGSHGKFRWNDEDQNSNISQVKQTFGVCTWTAVAATQRRLIGLVACNKLRDGPLVFISSIRRRPCFVSFSVWLFQFLVVEAVYLNKRTGLIIVEDPRGSLLFFADISTNIPQTATNQIGFGKTVHNMFKGTGNPQWPLIRNKPWFAARCFKLLYQRALTASESFRNVYGQIASSNQQRKPRRPIWPATFLAINESSDCKHLQTKTVIRRVEERIFWILHQN